MAEQPKIVTFPKTKVARPGAPKSDEDLLKDIHKAQRALGRAMDAATAAGLKLDIHIDSGDALGDRRVRNIDARATRNYG